MFDFEMKIVQDDGLYVCFLPAIRTTLTGSNIVDLIRQAASVIEDVCVKCTGKS